MSNYPTRAGVDSAEPLEWYDAKDAAEANGHPRRTAEVKRLTISTTVTYRGRTFTVSAEGYTVDRLCDMLDEKFGAPKNGEHTPAAPALPVGGPPLCPVHKREMKPMKYPSKQGHMWHCTAKVGSDGWCDERA